MDLTKNKKLMAWLERNIDWIRFLPLIVAVLLITISGIAGLFS